MQFRYWNVSGFLMLVCGLLLSGCGEAATAYPLNEELARSSVQKAMQSWVDGKAPADLKPDIIVGDQAWEQGRRLTAFQVLCVKAYRFVKATGLKPAEDFGLDKTNVEVDFIPISVTTQVNQELTEDFEDYSATKRC